MNEKNRMITYTNCTPLSSITIMNWTPLSPITIIYYRYSRCKDTRSQIYSQFWGDNFFFAVTLVWSLFIFAICFSHHSEVTIKKQLIACRKVNQKWKYDKLTRKDIVFCFLSRKFITLVVLYHQWNCVLFISSVSVVNLAESTFWAF